MAEREEVEDRDPRLIESADERKQLTSDWWMSETDRQDDNMLR